MAADSCLEWIIGFQTEERQRVDGERQRLDVANLSLDLAKKLQDAEIAYRTIQDVASALEKANNDLVLEVSQTTTNALQDVNEIMQLTTRRNDLARRLKGEQYKFVQEGKEINRLLRVLTPHMKCHTRLRRTVHQLEMVSSANATLERALAMALERHAEIKDKCRGTRRGAASRLWNRGEDRQRIVRELRIAPRGANTTQVLAMQRLSGFFDRHIGVALANLGGFANDGSIVPERTSSSNIRVRKPAVTEVQWRYHCQQKLLATTYPNTIVWHPAPDPSSDLAVRWQEVAKDLQHCWDLHARVISEDYWREVVTAYLEGDENAVEADCNAEILQNDRPPALGLVQTAQHRFLETQEEAMRAGLDPIADIDSDVYVFEEHRDDGTVDSESLSARRGIALAAPDHVMRRRMLEVIVWNLKVPPDQSNGFEPGDVPEMEEWEVKSVGLGSSRSDLWRCGEHPHGKERHAWSTTRHSRWHGESNRIGNF